MAAVSPLAPARFPALAPIAGVRLAAFACGIRYTGRDDLMIAELAPGSAVAGVFTRSLTAGAPVAWCRECLGRGTVRAIGANSGYTNVFAGPRGKRGGGGTRGDRGARARLRAEAGVHLFNGRDRRAAAG